MSKPTPSETPAGEDALEKTPVIREAEARIVELEKRVEPVDEEALTREALRDFRPAKPGEDERDLEEELGNVEATRVLLVAGDISGDAYGAALIAALRKQRPGLQFIGAGGPKMAAEGQRQVYDLTRHAVVGLTELAKHLITLRDVMGKLAALAKRERPELVVFIDYGGFNLRLLPRLRGLLKESKLVYFVSPQVWASRPSRAQVMAKNLDLLLSIFPFEKKWFQEHASKLEVNWVGHPKLDLLQAVRTGQSEAGRIGILPGSREREIERHLPALWAAAAEIHRQRPGVHFALMAPDAARAAQVRDWIEAQPAVGFDYDIYTGYTLSHLNRCELALVKSGTGSLDCALMGVPQIVVYKVNQLTYAIGRQLVKVKHLSMVNVLAGDRDVVPELIQRAMTPDKIAALALELLRDPARQAAMKQEMAAVVGQLGEPGAIGRAAGALADELKKVPTSVRVKRKELVQADLTAAIKKREQEDEARKQKLAEAAINAKKKEQADIQKGIEKAQREIENEYTRQRREKEKAERERVAAIEKAEREKKAAEEKRKRDAEREEQRKKREAEKAEQAKLAAAAKAEREKKATQERQRQQEARAKERAAKEAELRAKSEAKAAELAQKREQAEKEAGAKKPATSSQPAPKKLPLKKKPSQEKQ
ncbi:MAG: lipid-A-disaccharide synthase [Verrucomicrobiota bacterium]